jgi:Cof subfamily protein (haloacid dehalogenase superfamily)
MIKILAFDLDKTILNDEGIISEKDRRTLRRLSRQKKIIVIASGRMTDSIRPFAGMLGIDTPIIAYNGAMVRDSKKGKNRILYHQPLPHKYGDSLIDYCQKNHYHLNYYFEDKLYSSSDSSLRKYSSLYAGQTKSVYNFLPDLKCFKGKNPTKLILITEPEIRDRLYREFQAKFGKEINVIKTNPEYLEFMDKKADKWKGLEAIARKYRVKIEEIMTFGDGDNDIPMLKHSGTGVAVANASDKVKATVDYVTTATNNQSPVTEMVDKLEI